jgi:hypothetical protein
MAKSEQSSSSTVEVPKTRSPNYPTYKLEAALGKVKELWDSFKQHSMPVNAVFEKMGFTPSSSTAAQALAALKAYGLVEIQGNGDDRKVAVSVDAAKIIAKHPDGPKLLQKVALAPKIHKELADRFMTAGELAPDAAITHYLCFDRKEGLFNHQSVVPFLRQFKSTLAFANVNSSAKMSEENEPPLDDKPETEIKVGDAVQWVSGGVAQFTTPKRVSGFSADGDYAFIEGEKTGVLAKELVVEKKAEKTVAAAIQAPANPNFNTPSSDGVPISVVMGKGAAQVITIPKMTQKAFDFFKRQLDAFAEAIVEEPAPSDDQK